MIIKQITLSNFRQYKEKQVIKFSCDKDKNVTVVLGVNTSGKTTLIQAFNWCLYDSANFKTRDLINSETLQNMGFYSYSTVYVEVVLEHEQKQYVISRSQRVSKVDFHKVKNEPSVLKVEYKEKNGEMQEISPSECRNTINKILPEALSGYFFFDGERISDINNKGDVVAAVRGLMGLETISEAVDHFNKGSNCVLNKLRKELDLGQEERNRRVGYDLDKAKDKLLSLNERVAKAKEEIEYFEKRKKELEAKILANADTKNRQIEKSGIEKDIDFLERNQENLEDKLVKDFSKNSFRFFALPLYKKVRNVLAEAKQEGEGIPEMHSKSIDFILARKKCICGADLSMNQGAVNHIKYEQSLLPPQHIGTVIRTYKERLKSDEFEIEDFAKTIENDFKAIRENANQLEDKKVRLTELSRLLQGNVDVGKFERDNAENERVLREKRELIYNLSLQIGEVKNQIQSLESSLDGLQLATEKNKRINKYLAYAQQIFNWFKESYDQAEEDVKKELYASINDIFSQMYHGKRIVEIDDNYRITLKIDNGNGVFINDTSPGLDTVKNFAFIAGIVDLARKKANEQVGESMDDISYSTEPYPVVMDAPFSNADEIHIANISKVLPQVAEQVILIVMKKDWEHAEPTMSGKIGVIYEIEKHSETNSTIKPILGGI